MTVFIITAIMVPLWALDAYWKEHGEPPKIHRLKWILGSSFAVALMTVLIWTVLSAIKPGQ